MEHKVLNKQHLYILGFIIPLHASQDKKESAQTSKPYKIYPDK